MKDDEFQRCRCGHAEVDHRWKKTSHYDGPEIFSNPFTAGGLQGHVRNECRLCSCERFDPPTKHKAKWFGIGIGIIVVLAIIYRVFIAV